MAKKFTAKELWGHAVWLARRKPAASIAKNVPVPASTIQKWLDAFKNAE